MARFRRACWGDRPARPEDGCQAIVDPRSRPPDVGCRRSSVCSPIEPTVVITRTLPMQRRTAWLGAVLALSAVLHPRAALAHGETARGGGSANALNAMGGFVGPGWGFGLRLELRQFEEFTDAQLSEFVLAGEDVHQHSQEMSAFANANVTLLPDLDISLVLPFNAFRNFREAAERETRASSSTTSPPGSATSSRSDATESCGRGPTTSRSSPGSSCLRG